MFFIFCTQPMSIGDKLPWSLMSLGLSGCFSILPTSKRIFQLALDSQTDFNYFLYKHHIRELSNLFKHHLKRCLFGSLQGFVSYDIRTPVEAIGRQTIYQWWMVQCYVCLPMSETVDRGLLVGWTCLSHPSKTMVFQCQFTPWALFQLRKQEVSTGNNHYIIPVRMKIKAILNHQAPRWLENHHTPISSGCYCYVDIYSFFPSKRLHHHKFNWCFLFLNVY